MGVWRNRDRSQPVEIGHVFLLCLFLYSMQVGQLRPNPRCLFECPKPNRFTFGGVVDWLLLVRGRGELGLCSQIGLQYTVQKYNCLLFAEELWQFATDENFPMPSE
jgi:hypothetical protein